MSKFIKEEFTKGQMIQLKLVSELEKIDFYGNKFFLRTLKDDQGRLHTEKRTNKDIIVKKNIGEIVAYEVVGWYQDFSPILREISLHYDNFIKVSELSKRAQEKFNEYKNYSVKDSNYDLALQYDSKNGNWIWTFLTYLNEQLEDMIVNYDVSGSSKIGVIITETYNYLLKSKFLLSYKPEKRKEIGNRISNSIQKVNNTLFLLENIIGVSASQIKNQALNIANNCIEELELEVNSNESIYLLKLLIEKFELELPNELFEEITSVIESCNDNALKNSFARWSRERKRRIRYNLFQKESDVSNPNESFSLKNNPDLKHLIFITKFDRNYGPSETTSIPHNVLTRASILRYEAYLDADAEKAKECIDFLYENTGKDTLIENEHEKKEWRNSFNFEMALTYRFLAKNSTNIDATILLYKSSTMYYEKINSLQGELNNGFIKYFEMAKLIESKSALSNIKERSLKEYEKLKHPENRNLIEAFPFLGELKELFSILSLIGSESESESSFYRLFEIALRKFDKSIQAPDTLYLSTISGLVLASNLIDDNEQTLLKNQLPKVFSMGAIEVQNLEIKNVDVNSEEYKENKLIKTLEKTESQTLEFKGSWNLDIDVFILPKDQRANYKDNEYWGQSSEVSRAVASMMNANQGGKLYIGILEIKDKYKKSKKLLESVINRMNAVELDGGNNLLVGIESEIKRRGWDSDLLIQNINNQLKEDIADEVAQYCLINSRIVKNKEIIEITIQENSFSKFGWFINNDTDLPIRENNLIVTHRGRKALEWLEKQDNRYQI